MMTRVFILCGCLLGGSACIAWANRSAPVPARTSLDSFPLELGTWQGQDAGRFSDQIMEVLRVDDYANRYYASPGTPALSLYIGYYLSQHQGDSIHSPLNCLPGAGWNPVKREYLEIQAGDTKIKVNRIVILKGLEKQVVLYWYQSHGRVMASEYQAKFYTILDAMRTGRTDAALVRIVSEARSLEPAAEDEACRHAIDFARTIYPLLNRYIPE
jgi:EpsI family protein